MHRKDRKKRKSKKRKITVNSEYSKDEADVRAMMKSRENRSEAEPNSDIETDFFCSICTENAEEKQSDHSSQGNAQDSDSNPAENPTALLASAYVNIEETNPVCPALVEKITKDADLLFVPSYKKLLSEDRLERTVQCKDDENEGVFVQDHQKLEGSNVNRLVNRFLEEDYEGNVENVVVVEKLLDETVCKTISELHFAPNYFPPTPLCQLSGENNNNRFTLIVRIKELVFTDHPFFSEENKAALKLKTSYETYKKIISTNTITKLTAELSTTRNIVSDMLEDESINKKKLENHMIQIRTLRNELHSRERALKTAIFECIDNWKILKSIRKKQELPTTNLKLSIKVVEKNTEMAQELWSERFEIELNEIIRETLASYYRAKKKAPKSGVRKPNVEDLRDELNEVFERDLIGPNDPDVVLELKQTDNVGKPFDKPKHYFLKVFFDKSQVCSTKDVKLSRDFILKIDKTIGINLEGKMPEAIMFQICEKTNFLPDQKLSEAMISIPPSASLELCNELEFSSNKGPISGYLKIDIFSKHENFNTSPTVEIFKQKGLNRSKNQPSHKNHQTSDSENESLGDVTSNTDHPESTRTDCKSDSDLFTFTEELETFCSKADFDNNKRFKMLSARYKNELKFKDKRFIPTFDKEMEDEAPGRAIEGVDWFDPIDIDKHKGKKYVKNIYQMVLNHCERLNRNEDADNLLIGDEPPTFSSILSSLLGIFSSARPLNLLKSSPAPVQPSTCSKFNIIINVVRATGVPFRQSDSQASLSRRNSGASFTYQVSKVSNVRPYVTVRCKDKTLRTMNAEGSNPTWNEQLVLQLSRIDLESKDDITFQLYDEYIEDLLNDDLARASEVYQRIHTNWLGELKFPLTTILSMRKVEGTFELDSPRILLGYMKPSLDTETETIAIENSPEIKKEVYLSLYINVEPVFEVPVTSMSHLECSELKELKIYIQEVCFEIKENFPEHFIDPLVSVANGKRVCITRLLEPLPLPFNITEDSDSMIRRYVSLFPVFRTTSNCSGLNGVWFSNQITLDASWASPKDLGVLLCSYYLSLEIPVALVLGVAYPYGDTSFVLLKESSEYILVDPCTGRRYPCNDACCPLIKVFCVVREDNVFFNIQSKTRATLTDFNVDNKSNWFPLFSKKHPAPNGEVHNLNYVYREPYAITNLQKTIERKIIKKINSWRSNRKTIWNRAFKEMLYNVLIELERDALFDRDENIYMDRIAQSYPSYKIFGYTQNFSYTNLSSISERIKATGIHLNPDKNVEFSLAVHIQQYPNNILSAWIFLISAIPFNRPN